MARPLKSLPSVWLYWVLNRSACEYGLPVSQDAANSFHHFGIFLQQHPSFSTGPLLFLLLMMIMTGEWGGGVRGGLEEEGEEGDEGLGAGWVDSL